MIGNRQTPRLIFAGVLLAVALGSVARVHAQTGNLVLSTENGTTLGGLSFQDEDLVDYDPTADTAVMLFDGSTRFSGNEDVDAVHILSNDHIVLSTTGGATLGGLSFQDEDLVDYDPATNTAVMLFDGSTRFSGNEDVDAVHILSNGHIVLSTTGGATLGGLSFQDEDLVDYDPATNTAVMLFDGSTRYSGNQDTKAAHVRTGVDHFEIAHDGSAGTCALERITITKHDSNHSVDTTYTGTVAISTTTANGDWSLVTGTGVFTNSGNGVATYAYGPADNGRVVLGFRSTFVETLNIDASDGTDSELFGEDPDLAVSTGVTETFRDEFNAVGYGGNDGTQSWTSDWIERFDDGTPGGGNVLVVAGELSLDDNPNSGSDPSAERELDLSSFSSADFSFDFRTIGNVDVDDSMVVEVSPNGGGSWTQLENITGINDINSSRSYDITAFMSANTRIRFRVNESGSGGTTCCYGGAGEQFRADNIQILASPSVVQCGADHFGITHDGFGIHCLSEAVDVTPLDAGGIPLTNYAEVIVLDTQTGTGSWTGTTGTGTLTDATANDGRATYTFSGTESFPVSFVLSYPEGPATFNIDVYLQADPTVRDDDAEGNIDFSPSGFAVTATPLGNPPGPAIPVPSQIAARSFNLHLTAYGQTPADPTCGVIESYDGPVDLKFWSTYDNPVGGSRQVNVDANPIATSEVTAALQTVSFVQGEAQTTARYKDVGQIKIEMKDDSVSNSDLPTGIRGGTNLFVVKPATFAVSGIQRTSDALANPGALDENGSAFIQAGDDFSVTATALDDVGDPTPNYGRENLPESVLLTPGIVAAGATNNPAIQFNNGFSSFAGGASTGTDFRWHEVGIINLTPSVGDGDYLGAGEVTGTVSGNVGRFIPFDFGVSLNTPEFGTACGNFSYLGQGFQYTTPPVISFTARSKPPGSSTTQNYTGSFWKMTDTKLLSDGAKTYLPSSLDTSLILGTDPVITDNGNGTGTLSFSDGGGIALARGVPQAPFDAEISLSINVIDADNVIYSANPVQFGSTAPGGGVAFDADKQMRWGRLVVHNAVGSELSPLLVPAEAQYFDGGGFLRNADDDCSSVAVTNLTLANDLETGQIDGDIAIGLGVTTATFGNTPFVAGLADLNFSAPGIPNTGYADLVLNLSAGGAGQWWLQYDWDNDGNNDNDPAGRATFGVYTGSQFLIYVREPWN
jgi:hypothetical protein